MLSSGGGTTSVLLAIDGWCDGLQRDLPFICSSVESDPRARNL